MKKFLAICAIGIMSLGFIGCEEEPKETPREEALRLCLEQDLVLLNYSQDGEGYEADTNFVCSKRNGEAVEASSDANIQVGGY
jgi:hypothetical protein